MTDLKLEKLEGRLRKILSHYGGEIAAGDVFFRGIRGGFSGSRVFEVSGPGTAFILKQWPALGPTFSRLAAIHHVVSLLGRLDHLDLPAKAPAVAVPLKNRAGQTITVEDDVLWDLTPKLPGAPKDPLDVAKSDITAAMQSIALIHLALNRLSPDFPSELRNSFGNSPGLLRRRKWIRALAANWREVAAKLKETPLPCEIRTQCSSLFSAALPVAQSLDQTPSWEGFQLPLQACLRDLWYEHVLFENSQVSGIIDFGSIGVDSVMTDLARLLRSWIATSGADFTEALDAYHEIHPISTAEREAFTWFDRTSRILSAFQWIEWLAIERRDFDDWAAVSARLDFVLARLPLR